uniref:Uncharacterized protein n=1 Tax=Manihot esculenta TaxID=3983 RepID=A0A2C9VF89_MANES
MGSLACIDDGSLGLPPSLPVNNASPDLFRNRTATPLTLVVVNVRIRLC